MVRLVKQFEHGGISYQFASRHDVAKLVPSGAIGIELGTASGNFSQTLLQKFDFGYLYTVDKFGNHNEINQYRHAFFQLEPYRNRCAVLPITFELASKLFPSYYFDFIYVDGYAYTGHDQGTVYTDWWPLLKKGGVFAGDDYCDQYPLVQQNIKDFAQAQNCDLYVIDCPPGEDWASQNPTWFMIK
jgi:hypothetical protein